MQSRRPGDVKNITSRNRGYDASPIYTRDGKYIIYRSQATAGFEADRWRLMSYNRATGATVELTQGFDLQVEDVVLSPDGNRSISPPDESWQSIRSSACRSAAVCREKSYRTFSRRIFRSRPDGRKLVFAVEFDCGAAEIYTVNTDGSGLNGTDDSERRVAGAREFETRRRMLNGPGRWAEDSRFHRKTDKL